MPWAQLCVWAQMFILQHGFYTNSWCLGHFFVYTTPPKQFNICNSGIWTRDSMNTTQNCIHCFNESFVVYAEKLKQLWDLNQSLIYKWLTSTFQFNYSSLSWPTELRWQCHFKREHFLKVGKSIWSLLFLCNHFFPSGDPTQDKWFGELMEDLNRFDSFTYFSVLPQIDMAACYSFACYHKAPHVKPYATKPETFVFQSFLPWKLLRLRFSCLLNNYFF